MVSKLYKNRRTSIYWKILGNSIFFVIIMSIMIFLTTLLYRTVEEINDYRGIKSSFTKIFRLREQLNRPHDRFYAALYNKNTEEIKLLSENIDSILSARKQDLAVDEMLKLNKLYLTHLTEYNQLQHDIGLNEDKGLENSFRSDAHEIENILLKYPQTPDILKIYNTLLQIRRREKDYKMRERDKYIVIIDNLLSDMKNKVRNSAISKDDKEIIISKASHYSKYFRKYVDIRKKIAEAEQLIQAHEDDISYKIEKIVDTKTMKADRRRWLQIGSFFSAIVLGLILSVVTARSIARPVIHLQKATLRITEGDHTFKAQVKSRDEIEDLAHFFNDMMVNINESKDIIVSQNEKLKELNATKDKFFSIIAHDLKNPISAFSGIAGFINSRFDELDENELKEFISDIDHSAKHLFELLENLLTWSRVQKRSVPYSPAFIDIKPIIDNNIYLLKLTADNKSIDLSSKVDQNSIVYADANMINTVLRNLISNAIKFTPEGGSIKIFSELLPDVSKLKITVKDTGVGMPPEKVNKLFKLDTNVSTEGTNHEKGTGLGLILCKEFVELNKGTISVESELDKGTRIHFTLPVREAGFVK